jgi:hypothetical protein
MQSPHQQALEMEGILNLTPAAFLKRSFLFGRTLLTHYKLQYQNIRWKKMIKSEETSFTKFSQKTDIALFIATMES